MVCIGVPVHDIPGGDYQDNLLPEYREPEHEGLNSKIQSLKSAARGFRSFVNYRIRILFFCGKLDLYPL